MAVTMSQLLGSKEDVVEDCRKQVKMLALNEKYRMAAEIIMKDGTRRIYRTKAIDRKSAIRETLTFVEALEQKTGDKVMWKFKGESLYQFSNNYTAQPSLISRAKKAFLGYFFDLED